MFGKVLLSLLLVMGAATAASADDPPIGPPTIPPDEEGTWYGEQLALRVSSAEHVDELVARFGNLDGQVLIEQTIGEDHWLIFWSAALEHVQIAKNGEFVAMTPSYDAYGRAVFECEDLSGWVDVADEYIQGEITPWNESPLRYAGLYPEDGAQPGVPGAPVIAGPAKKECVCKGTNAANGCNDDSDCTNAQPCTYEKDGTTVNSKCIWAAVPVKTPKPSPTPPEPVPSNPHSTPTTPQPDPSEPSTCAGGTDAAGLGIAIGLTGFLVSSRIRRHRGAAPRR